MSLRRTDPSRMLAGPPLSGGQRGRRALQRAHTHLQSGQYREAARIFGHLAEMTGRRGLPRAAHLRIQAGRAHILAGEFETGMAAIDAGITSLIKTERQIRALQLAPRLKAFLIEHGLEARWRALETRLDEAGLPAHQAVAEAPFTGKLPAKCPYCGATLIPEELEVSMENDALCDYCGSLVQREALG